MARFYREFKNDEKIDYEHPKETLLYFKHLSPERQAKITNAINDACRELNAADRLEASTNALKARRLWTRAWIVKLLKNEEIQRLLPETKNPVLSEDENALLEKALELVPENVAFLCSKADFSLKWKPDGLEGFAVDPSNKEAVGLYEKALRLRKAPVEEIFAILSRCYRQANDQKSLRSALEFTARKYPSNGYYAYYQAEQSLDLSQTTLSRSIRRNQKELTIQNARFISFAERGAQRSDFHIPIYKPSVPEPLLSTWELLYQDMSSLFREPEYDYFFGATLTNAFQNEQTDIRFQDKNFHSHCIDISLNYHLDIIRYFISIKPKTKISDLDISPFFSCIMLIEQDIDYLEEIDKSIIAPYKDTVLKIKKKSREYLLKNGADPNNVIFKNALRYKED